MFRLAADAVNGIISEWDIASGHVHRSRGVLEVLGLEPGELEATADAWYARIHPADFESTKRAINLGLLNGRGWTATYRVRDVRGRYRSILERGLVQRNAAGDPVRAIDCCVDVSEINRVTDLLAETQRAAKMGGWEYSYATRELTWTDEMYRIYEASPEEFAVSWHSMLAQCTPESRQRFHDACRRSEVTGGPARSGARNHDPEEPAPVGADHRASGDAGRPPVPRLRFGAERAGAESWRKSPWRTAPGG